MTDQPDPSALRAVFYDVDLTLIHPGPVGHGSRACSARWGITVDSTAFDDAVAAAAPLLAVASSPAEVRSRRCASCRR